MCHRHFSPDCSQLICFTCNRAGACNQWLLLSDRGSRAPETLSSKRTRTVEEAAFVAAMKGRRAAYSLTQT